MNSGHKFVIDLGAPKFLKLMVLFVDFSEACCPKMIHKFKKRKTIDSSLAF